MKATPTKHTHANVQQHTAESPVFQKQGAEDTSYEQQQSVYSFGNQSGEAAAIAPVFHKSPVIQTKLTIGQPGDKYEQEADQMADNVVQKLATPGAPPSERNGSSAGSDLHRKPIFESNEETPAVQTQSDSGTEPASPSLESRLNNTKGSGSPLPDDTRSGMEGAFGTDFSGVRVHNDSSAVQMNKELGAQAFTHGSDIYFGAGKYDTESSEGKGLLAHELTHTVQQGEGVKKKETPDIQAYWGEGLVDSISDAASDVGGFVADTASDIGGAAWDGIKYAGGKVADGASAVYDGVEYVGGKIADGAGAVWDGVKWVGGKIADGFMAAVNFIKRKITAGTNWVQGKWDALYSFATNGLASLKNLFNGILSFLTDPLGIIADAIMNMDVEAIRASWNGFTGFVLGVWDNLQAVGTELIDTVQGLFDPIDSFVSSLFDSISEFKSGFIYRHLPGFIQDGIDFLIDGLRSLWATVKNGWDLLFNEIRAFVDEAFQKVRGFIDRILSFAFDAFIAGILNFGKLLLFIRDLFTNPEKYIEIMAQWAVDALGGVEDRFSEFIGQYFGGGEQQGEGANADGVIQKSPDASSSSSSSTTKKRSSASWSEIGQGVWSVMKQKWNEFKNNPLSIITGLLWDLVLPIVGNIKDIVNLFKDIYKIVTKPLGAGSLEELWTSFLQILDIPILIYHTIVSILMRTLMLPLIVATFIPHPIVKGIAAAVGYALLGAFVQAETLNIGHKLLLLKTGSTTDDEKNDAYNRVGDSLIAFAMAAAIALIMLILHFIANVIKGIFNFVKGKIFPPARMATGSKPGLKSTPETIQEGSVAMEQHPNYQNVVKEIETAGFEIKQGTPPRVEVLEVVDPQGNLIRVEKTVFVEKGMRFLDLEHELGHMRQITQRFGEGKTLPTDRVTEFPNGKRKPAPNQSEILTVRRNSVTEYHNRLAEFLRLKERGANPELLKEHAGGVKEWRQDYLDRNLRSPSAMEWVKEHFPDLPDLEQQYADSGGRLLE